MDGLSVCEPFTRFLIDVNVLEFVIYELSLRECLIPVADGMSEVCVASVSIPG